MPESNTPKLTVSELQDLVSRKNWQALVEYFNLNNQLLAFRHLEHKALAAESNVKIAHGLGYEPKDIILTRVVGSGTITFNYSRFDSQYIDVTFSGAVRFRAFVGTYWQDASTEEESSTDTQTARATL